MTPHNQPEHPRLAYSPQALAACEKALRTILTKIGPWGTRLVLIGGMAPRYLVGDLPADISEHVGTTDLDIVVGIALESEEDEAYRTLQQNLKDAQFAPRRNPDTNQEETFRWTREVDGVSVVLEFFCPVGEGNAGQLLRNPGKNVGSKISAMRIRGAELAGRDHITINLGGELLDHGGIQERIEVRVCNLLPLLVLKSFAIDERDKSKDSYDLVWILNAFQEGPASVVDAIADSPVIDHADIPAAIQAIRTHFQSPGHRGPSQYANFELMADDAEQLERLRLHAHGTVAEFLRLWDRRGLPGAIG